MNTNDYINLYGIFRQLNSDILSKYNEDESSLKFYDFYLFHMTSFSCGILYELLQNCSRISTSQLFFVRSLIEDIAVIRMYDNVDVLKNSEYLLKGFNFMCEKDLYKKFKDLDGKYFDLSEIEKNASDYIEDFKRVYREDFPTSSYKKILDNRNLAFLEENYNYLDLIEFYASEYLVEYKILSIICHISDIRLSDEFINNYDRIKLIDRLIKDVFIEVDEYYGDSLKILKENTFKYESNLVGISSNNINPFLKCSVNEVKNIYLLASNISLNYSKVYNDTYLPAVFFSRIGLEIEALSYDFCYGFYENAKSRIKPILEMISTFHFINKHIRSKEDLWKLKLMQVHFNLNISKNIKEVSEEEFNDLGYVNFNYKEFKEIRDKSLISYFGYNTINQFVYEMIDDYITNKEQNLICKLIYAESQYFSHGNGYSLTSNLGAFMDIDPCVDIVDNLLLCTIKEYSATELVNSLYEYNLHKDNYNLAIKYLEILKENIDEKKKIREEIKNNKMEKQ